ncbi:MAG: site-specific DNA-methyltransferase, partial [Sphingomonadaceae bacterium]
MPTNRNPRRDLNIVERPRTSLIPYANNARTHSKSQVKKLARSIERWGWTNPVIIDEHLTVLAGHGRLEAAALLGIAMVPTIMLADMSDADKRAYILADNVIADKAGYSKELLAIELEGLIDIGFEVELTGFDTIEIDTLIGTDDGDEDSVESIELPRDHAVPVSRLGDLWQIGDHRILCGDARERACYERLLAGDLAQMVFTDPPYNVPIAGNVSGLGRHVHGDFQMACGEMTDQQFSSSFLRPVLRNLAAHCAPGAIAFVCIDWRNAPQLLDAADGVFAELKNLIVWAKTNASMGTFYRSQHELIYAFKTSKGPHLNNFGLGEGGRHRSNLWTYPGANTFRKGRLKDLAEHPTVKPRKLVMDAILDVSKRGGLVHDAFAGAGTTLVAAARTGRRGAAIELDPKYVDLCVRNLAQETGAIARLST